jgi:hypothetical protein
MVLMIIIIKFYYIKLVFSGKRIAQMFMNQIFSLKKLTYYSYFDIIDKFFTYFPGAKDCLADLLELRCSSNI